MKSCFWFAIIALGLAGPSCSRQEAIQERTRQELAGIARVGERSISEEDFKDLLARRVKSSPEAFATLEQKERLLEELIRTEAIYTKAIAAGFDQRPDIAAAIKKLVVGRFQGEQLSNRASTPITDADARRFYDQNKSRFAQPPAVNGAVIFLKTSAKAGEEQVARRREEAEAIWQQASIADGAQFRTLAALHSEDQTSRYRGGATGWITRENLVEDWDPAVLDALFLLDQPGAFAPLVATPRGFYLVKLVEKRAASVKPFEQVRERIAHDLKHAREEEREREFYAAMKSGLNIEINREALQSISLPQEIQAPPPTPGAQTARIGR